MPIVRTTNQRGFTCLGFTTTYMSAPVKIQESSSAETARVWLTVKDATVALDQKEVAELIPHLQKFVGTGEL